MGRGGRCREAMAWLCSRGQEGGGARWLRISSRAAATAPWVSSARQRGGGKARPWRHGQPERERDARELEVERKMGGRRPAVVVAGDGWWRGVARAVQGGAGSGEGSPPAGGATANERMIMGGSYQRCVGSRRWLDRTAR